MKILIVEDDENSRVLLESALNAKKYDVESADNGKIALEIANNSHLDLIISDILMPEMDGYSLCRAVMSDNKLCDIPFVFYSATYTEEEDKKLAMDIGATKFLVKPMEMDKFLIEIEKILDDYKLKLLTKSEKIEIEEIQVEKNYSNVVAKKLYKKVLQLEHESEKLSKSERKYRQLVEALRDNYFFFTHEINCFFKYISPSIQNVLGYTQEEFQKNYKNFLTQNSINNKFLTIIENNITNAKQEKYEIEICHKNGTAKRLYISEEPILNKNGKIFSVEGIAQDITQQIIAQKELERTKERLQQAQKIEAIGTLAGGIAHDFNNILTPIFGYTEMIKKKLPEGSKEWNQAQTILSAAHRARDLVRQILTFSRQNNQEKKSLRLQLVIQEVIKFLNSTIPKNITIKTNIDKNCNPIYACPIQMHQVIMNLCTNAYQAMRETGGIMAISLSELEICSENFIIDIDLGIGKYLRLEVSDTGIGIEKKNLKRIFEPYYTTKSRFEGTGLGMSVIHGIVKNHNGHISVYSEPGIGSTFHIYLPVVEKKVRTNKTKLTENIEGGTERVLLIDDDEVIAELEKKQLESLGYNVTAITSSLKAFEIFNSSPDNFDIIITDMNMPDMSGSELAQRILKIRPNMPILILTGFSELIDKEISISMGIKEYIMKPFTKMKLAKTLRKVLDSNVISVK